MSENTLEECHYIEITDNVSNESYAVVYKSYNALNEALDLLFESEGDFDVYYDLDEDLLSLKQFMNIINKNPKVKDLENPDNCQTIQEFKDWVDNYMDLIEIEEFLSS